MKKRGEERRETKHIPSRKTTNYKIELQDNHGIIRNTFVEPRFPRNELNFAPNRSVVAEFLQGGAPLETRS